MTGPPVAGSCSTASYGCCKPRQQQNSCVNEGNMSSDPPSTLNSNKGGFPRLAWLAAAAAALAGYQIGQVTGFWGAQIRGPAANIELLGMTPHLYFLGKAV